MRSMQEMQNLIQALREVYTDVRLLDSTTIHKLQEGAPTAAIAEDLCYACRHKDRLSAHCAAKMALATRQEQCRLEYFEPDIAQITARYYEIDGEPYVLETVKMLHGDAIIDVEDSEHLLSEVSGYNTKLYHDALTGVFNRRYYEEVVRSMVGPAGVAVMDLDDFKVCNDTYGHHAGDMTLDAVSRAVRSCIRSTDILVRFGGDEFLLVMPAIPADYFRTKLEQIREKVRACVVPGYPHLHPSVSIGGAIQSLVDPMDIVIRRADRLMYQAKDQKDAVALADGTSAFLALDDPLNRRQQILIVDDSEMNRLLLSEILSRDYRILEAATGDECIHMLQQHAGDIALVLLDLIMPGMNGFEVLDYMNRNHTLEDIPVIMISSENSDASIRKAYERGASDYVNRPFDAKVVYQRVNNTIKLYAKQRRLVALVSNQIRKQERNTSMLVGVLSQIVEFRNGESGAPCAAHPGADPENSGTPAGKDHPLRHPFGGSG